MNAHLEEQARARDKIDAMRDDNDSMMRREFESTRKELQVSGGGGGGEEGCGREGWGWSWVRGGG